MNQAETSPSDESTPIVAVSTRAEFDVAVSGRAPKIIATALVTVVVTQLLRWLLDHTALMALVGISALA